MCIDKHDSDLGAVEGGLRAEGRVILMPACLLRPATDAGSVDEPPKPVTEFHELIDRVDGCARDGVDDDSLGSGERIEKRGLPDIGLAEQRNPTRTARPRGAMAFGWEHFNNFVEQITRTSTMQSRDRVRLSKTHRPERRSLNLRCGVISLVRDEEDRLVRTAQNLHNGLVGIGRPDTRINNEHHGIGIVDGTLCLSSDLRGHAPYLALPATRVDEHESLAVPLTLVGDPVAGHSRHIFDDRFAAPNDSVNEGGLPDIRSADDGKDWQTCLTAPFEFHKFCIEITELGPSRR